MLKSSSEATYFETMFRRIRVGFHARNEDTDAEFRSTADTDS